MIALQRRPHAALASYVESIWLYEGYRPDHVEEIHLPDPNPQLVVDLRESRPAAGIVGPTSRPFSLSTDCQFSVVGVQFCPGAAAAVLGLPLHGTLNENVALEDAWGREAFEFQERLHCAASPSLRLQVVDDFLSARLRGELSPLSSISAAALTLRRHGEDRLVLGLVEQSGLGYARFIESFEESFGLRPKLFQRLHRFQRAVRLLHRYPESLTSVALASGYFDQAHFSRDFREFSGMTAAAYRAKRAQHVNHVPVANH